VLDKHDLIAVICYTPDKLILHSLVDGSLVREIAGVLTGERLQFGYGGVCAAPDGDSVLAVDSRKPGVQQVWVVDDGDLRARVIGRDVIEEPEYIDCNADCIVVFEPSKDNRVTVLSTEGVRLKQFSIGRFGGQCLLSPRGIRLVAKGREVITADNNNHRLVLWSLDGEFVTTVGSEGKGLFYPRDMLECTSDDSFIVCNFQGELVKVNRDGDKLDTYGEFGSSTSLAALPNGGVIVLSYYGTYRITILKSLALRFGWLQACATLATKPGVAPLSLSSEKRRK
jgi:hypothetical protein